MAKCSMVGCEGEAIGGFQTMIQAGTLEHPNAEIPGGQTRWCEYHEMMLRPTVVGKWGRWLTEKEAKG
jgi:hypothetical protein